MHNNYYFLRQLTRQLEKLLTGATLVECFSQTKDELVLIFEKDRDTFTLKAHLQSTFSCLSFPREFHRARKNSIDLFQSIVGFTVQHIQQFKNERCFALHFDHSKSLLFKLHGNRSNIILFEEDEKTLFKNSLPADENLELAEIDRIISFDKHSFELSGTPQKLYFTFGPVVWRYLYEQGFNNESSDAQWKMIEATLGRLNNPEYYLVNLDNNITLSLLPIGEIIRKSENPIDILNEFYYNFTQTQALREEKQKALTLLNNRLKSGQSFLVKTKLKYQELAAVNTYKVWADLLMAYLHNVPERAKKITLPDFSDASKLIEIPLSEKLSPQKNAERYYRKSKNHQLEIDKLQEIMEAKAKALTTLSYQVQEITNTHHLKKLRQLIDQYGLQQKKQTETVILPYRSTEFQGYHIWVGKNAKANDELTLKYTYKEDLWLHAKDVSGSHVVIKYKANQPFPKDVIERAAQLAAYFSKRKTDSLCPVAYTPKKFVRKRKGDPAGMVVVEKETVILVEPQGL